MRGDPAARRFDISTYRYSPLRVEITISRAKSSLESEHAPEKQISIGGKTMTIAELLGQLDDYQALYAGARALHAQLHALLAEQRRRHREVTTFLQALRAALVGLYGVEAPELERFGFDLRKQPAPLTVEQIAVKAFKLRETRRLRHTMGNRQKAALKAVGPVDIRVAFPETPPRPASEPADPASSGADVAPAADAGPMSVDTPKPEPSSG